MFQTAQNVPILGQYVKILSNLARDNLSTPHLHQHPVQRLQEVRPVRLAERRRASAHSVHPGAQVFHARGLKGITSGATDTGGVEPLAVTARSML